MNNELFLILPFSVFQVYSHCMGFKEIHSLLIKLMVQYSKLEIYFLNTRELFMFRI